MRSDGQANRERGVPASPVTLNVEERQESTLVSLYEVIRITALLARVPYFVPSLHFDEAVATFSIAYVDQTERQEFGAKGQAESGDGDVDGTGKDVNFSNAMAQVAAVAFAFNMPDAALPYQALGGTMLRALCALFHIVLFILCGMSAVAQHAPAVSADQIWDGLAAGNHRFVTGTSAPHEFPSQRKALTMTQHPRVAVLSCSDSRVPPELVFDTGLGDLFVVRSAGEIADLVSIGSLEYAVEHLGSTVILVMGHQSCGAVTAACSGGKPESVNLDAVVTPIAPSCARMNPKKPETLDLAVRDHVHRVAQELLAKSELLAKAFHESKLTIIEAYYSMETGEVTRLADGSARPLTH